ncbi:MAG: hypothetical protein JOZ80_15085, partial [Acidobacteriaceae bacterium]|nr:hypothetical protein [Acidobacteriaceae bacterium]
MNCQQARHHIEYSPQNVLDLTHSSGEILAHLSACFKCKTFVEEQRDLAANLKRIRESAPEIPQTVDAAVLDAFRRHVTTARHDEMPVRKRAVRAAIYVSSAALLAAVAVIVFFTLPVSKPAPKIGAVGPPPHLAAAEFRASVTESGTRTPVKEANTHRKPVRASSRSLAVSRDQDLFPAGFASLMYCDRISCAGDMEIVRVQVSPSMLGLPLQSPGAAGPILADVLVGPDGIARG